MSVFFTCDGKRISNTAINVDGLTLAAIRQAIVNQKLIEANKNWSFLMFGTKVTEHEEIAATAEDVVEDDEIAIEFNNDVAAPAATAATLAVTGASPFTSTSGAQSTTSEDPGSSSQDVGRGGLGSPGSTTQPGAISPSSTDVNKASPTPPRTSPATVIPNTTTRPGSKVDVSLNTEYRPGVIKAPDATDLSASIKAWTITSAVGPDQSARNPTAILAAVLSNAQLPVALAPKSASRNLEPKVGSITLVDRYKLPGAKNPEKVFADAKKNIAVIIQGHNTNRYRAFESAILRDIYSSSTFNLVFESNGSLLAEGVSLEGGQAAAITRKKEQFESKEERLVYVSAVIQEWRASIVLDRSMVKATQTLQENVSNILDGFESDLQNLPERKIQLVEQLIASFETEGLVVPLTYHVGGRLSYSSQDNTTKSLNASTTEFETVMEHHAKVSIDAAKAGVETKSGAGYHSLDIDASGKTYHFTRKDSSCIGGDTSQQSSIGKWISSLDDASKLGVIGYDGLVPIWEFFEEPLRNRLFKFFKPSDLISTYAKRVNDSAQNGENVLTLLDAKEELKMVKIVDAPEKALINSWVTVGLTEAELPGSTALDVPKVMEDWSPLGSSSKEITIGVNDKKMAITYLKIRTSYDPPGKWEITDGGLLERQVSIRFTAHKMRGQTWTIEACHAPVALTVMPERQYSDLAVYNALRVGKRYLPKG